MIAETLILGDCKYQISLLTGDDEKDVQTLCEKCMDYWEMVEGRPPEKDAGHEILFDLPPGKELKDKYVLGIYKDQVLIGVVDIIKDYKDKGEWIIGLMMIDPQERGKGLGRKIHDLIKDWVLEEQGEKLRIGVVEENHQGYKFWCDMGYAEVDRTIVTYGNKVHTVIVMNLILN